MNARFRSPLRARLSAPPVALAFAVASLLGFTGCATSGDRTASASPSTGTPRTGWHDPDFYTPWHDPKSIVLPPPPFTGFSDAGKVTPMLPNQPRPAANAAPAPASASAP